MSALGNILQIVSAPGQPLLRPQGPPMVMPTVPQAVPVQTSTPPQGEALLRPQADCYLHKGWPTRSNLPTAPPFIFGN